MPVPEKWGYQSDQSQLEYRPEGLFNVYDKNKETESGPEYITIYNPNGSLLSRIVSIVLILAVLGFCILLFKYVYNEHGGSQQTAQAQAPVQAHAK